MGVLAKRIVNFFYELLEVFAFWVVKVGDHLYFSGDGITPFSLIAITLVVIVLFVALLNVIRAVIQLR